MKNVPIPIPIPIPSPEAAPPALTKLVIGNLGTHQWNAISELPWWSTFCERKSVPADQVFRVCLGERVLWSLGCPDIVQIEKHRVFDDLASTELTLPFDTFESISSFEGRLGEEISAVVARVYERNSFSAAFSFIPQLLLLLPISLLLGASRTSQLGLVAEKFFPQGDRPRVVLNYLVKLSRCRGESPGLLVDWSVAGELDSPVTSAQVEYIRSRRPLSIATLILSSSPSSRLFWVTDEEFDPEVIMFEAGTVKDAVPLLIDCRDLSVDEGLSTVVHRCLERLHARPEAATGTRIKLILILFRPDLARINDRPLTGLQLREIVAQYSRNEIEDRVIAVTPSTSFATRHSYPGSVIVWACCKPLPKKQLFFVPPGVEKLGILLWRRFIDHLRLLGETPREGVASEVFDLFGKPEIPWSDDIDWFEMARYRPKLEELLRQLIKHPWSSLPSAMPKLDNGFASRSLHADELTAYTAAGLYELIFKLAPHGERNTFVECDLSRWFCFLASVRYECLARVTARMERERLGPMHLMCVPPLEWANFQEVDLEFADLYHVNLANANLRGARLRGADLSRAHLKRADLRDADLRDADLSYTCLEFADVRGADLRGCNFHRAFIDFSEGLTL